MSAADETPARWRGILKIGVAVVMVCATFAFFAFCTKEDHRVTYDKEGRYLPHFSLRELALAMHSYHDKHGRLPPAVVYSEAGEPLLSWRVLLLPYLEQDELFRQFNLDEPWNSRHNILLLAKMPITFSPLRGNPPLEPYTTLFQVFVGKGAAFEGREGLRLKEDFSRRSCTILIVEAGTSVPWTKPQDIPYDKDQPLPRFGGYFDGNFHVALADGSARSIRQDINPATLHALIHRSGDGPGDDW